MKKRIQQSWRRPTDPKSGKPYTELITHELREATKEFDEPFVVERTSRPLSPKQRAEYRRALKGSSASTKVAGTTIQVTVQPALLRRADAYAKKCGLTRSQLVAHGLEALLSSAA